MMSCSFASLGQMNLRWAKKIGSAGNGSIFGKAIAADAAGNVYTTGSFIDTIDFDPGSADYELSGYDIIFLSKLTRSGDFAWATTVAATTGAGYGSGQSVAVDAFGNVYTTGRFYGTLDFDPGDNTLSLTSHGGYDIFIMKQDSLGELIWAKTIGGGNDDIGLSLDVNANSDVFITGIFSGTVDFNPGAGTNMISSVNAGSDIFVCKLDASGSFIWADAMGGPGEDYGTSVKAGSDGSVYTTGSFTSTADFDPAASVLNLIAVADSDIFVSKLDASGMLVWARQMGGAGSDIANSVSLDPYGNIYTTGTFNTTADFDPGAGTYNLSATGSPDVFVSKLDPAGNYVWAKRLGGADVAKGYTIAADSVSVYTIGHFEGAVDLDPGLPVHTFTSAGQTDIFVSCLSTAGNYKWAEKMGGTNADYSFSAFVNGSIYATGWFFGSSDFDPGSAVYNLTSPGDGPSTFVVKLGNTATGIDEDAKFAKAKIYPNPAGKEFTVELEVRTPGTLKMDLFDATGRQVIAPIRTELNSGENLIPVDLSGLQNGMYYLKAFDGNEYYYSKVLKAE